MNTIDLSLSQFDAGPSLLIAVRAGFVASGSSLNRWCMEHEVCRMSAVFALTGKRNGPKAIALRAQLIRESGIAT
ncbi:hypothetical protein [Mesorhizobium xinjiangense]|uniref:hypothetical protein n=1 Tax=Mesorhizobium xinjiangense TaxID=2678685 RepID=UPI0012EEDF6E|nr:hypothetical protein [Mesorhizobium xinjiangense]